MTAQEYKSVGWASCPPNRSLKSPMTGTGHRPGRLRNTRADGSSSPGGSERGPWQGRGSRGHRCLRSDSVPDAACRCRVLRARTDRSYAPYADSALLRCHRRSDRPPSLHELGGAPSLHDLGRCELARTLLNQCFPSVPCCLRMGPCHPGPGDSPKTGRACSCHRRSSPHHRRHCSKGVSLRPIVQYARRWALGSRGHCRYAVHRGVRLTGSTRSWPSFHRCAASAPGPRRR